MADLDKRSAVLGPQVYEGVPLSRAAAAAGPRGTGPGMHAAGLGHAPNTGEQGQRPIQRWLGSGWLPRVPEIVGSAGSAAVGRRDASEGAPVGIGRHGMRYLDLTSAAYVGEQITIRYDPRDLLGSPVFHEARFLCRAVSAELAASTISLKDLQAARNNRRLREPRTDLISRRSPVNSLRHPVQEIVPADAVTPAAPRVFRPGPARPATKFKLYRENCGEGSVDVDSRHR